MKTASKGKNNKNSAEIKTFTFRILLTIGLFFIFMHIGSLKSGYHVDEMLTFGLSNHLYSSNNSIHPEIHEGETYSGPQLWAEYTMVSKDHRFDYANVWENQEHDVHPPLYYAIVHTVYSFIPDVFNFKYALAINVIFALIIFWQMVWLFDHFIENRKLAVIFALMFSFTMGFINSIIFFRMYMLLMVWTNALIILFCKYKPEEIRWKYYILLTLILTGGTMTQYYFTIFAFFACAIYAFRVAVAKKWKKIVLSVFSVLVSVGLCSLIFPPMWSQIFSGYRGQEAFASLSESGLWGYIWNYLTIIDLRVFGNMFLLLAFMIVFLCIVSSKDVANDAWEQTGSMLMQYLQIIVPVVIYIVIIARISPYKSDRYVTNVMGLMYLVVFSLLILLAMCFSKQAVAGIFAIAALVLFCSYRNGVQNLYTAETERVETIAELGSDIPCIYVYGSTWEILYNYTEMLNLDNIIFIKNNNTDALNDDRYHHYDDLLVFVIANDTNKIADQILDVNPDLNSSKKLFSNGNATVYHLY